MAPIVQGTMFKTLNECASLAFLALLTAASCSKDPYMVWPEKERFEAFPDVSLSYRLAAQDVGGILLPAGDAWLAAWQIDPSLSLYGPDGFHPTVTGSYLAALTIYGGLTGNSTLGLPGHLQLRSGTTIDIDPVVAPRLQAAAEKALGR
jgi:hypothetical protein